MNIVSANGGVDDGNNHAPDFSYQQPEAGQPPVSTPATAEVMSRETGAGNIDKIRDILFGSNMRDYEQRFSRLEEALRKESADLRDTTRRHLETLESFVHKELADLNQRLSQERDERSDSHSRLAADLSQTATNIHRKIGEFENNEAQAKRDIRTDLLQQSKELNDAIRAKAEELAALLDRRFAELHHAKTDRAGLASLFSEVALRLNDQFKMPGVD
jgi:hypothetical protein